MKWRNLTDDDPNKVRSKTQQDKYNKKLNSLAQEFLAEKFVPVLQKDLNKHIRGSFDLELYVDKQTVQFAYPRLYKGSDAGILAALHPLQKQKLASRDARMIQLAEE